MTSELEKQKPRLALNPDIASRLGIDQKRSTLYE